ncbi:MAG TPA: TonB C-terminal domain-containing protein [Verrucomicrobiota bacterium]|nr:TonB C-terminal domain-containing protein [Verrucomicrobiota bacterium]
MNRLRYKCFFASTAMHGLLLVLFVAGSGFQATHREPESVVLPLLDFVPMRLVDAAVVGGGDPRGGAAPEPSPVQAPPSRPDPPKPKPEPVAPPKEEEAATPAPVVKKSQAKPAKVETQKPPEPDPEGFSDKAPTKPKRKIEVSKNLVTRRPQDDAAARKRAAEQAEAEAEAEAAQQAARARQARSGQVRGVLSKLQGNLSGPGVVAVPYGPGGGGETYAGYGLYVRMVYERAWRPPVEVPERGSVVTARVVIARDGSVVSAEIVERSKVQALDQSAASALGRVTTIGRPFPEGSTDERKTFLIEFDLKARQGTG